MIQDLLRSILVDLVEGKLVCVRIDHSLDCRFRLAAAIFTGSMVDECVSFVAGTLRTVVPEDYRNPVGLGQLRIVCEVILLKFLLTL